MNERLKILRKKLNLTLEQFGNKVGVTRSAVSMIESGKNKLTEQMLKSICREFSVNENWLRTGNGEIFLIEKKDYIETLGKTYSLDELDKTILDNYLSLSIEKRKIIKEYILSVAKQYNDKNEETKIKALIDKEVEAYRKELESEIKGASKSSISNISNTEEKNKKTS